MAHECKHCGQEFGAPATHRIHERTHGDTVVEKVVKAVKKVVKRKAK